jgi:hypothetical protein
MRGSPPVPSCLSGPEQEHAASSRMASEKEMVFVGCFGGCGILTSQRTTQQAGFDDFRRLDGRFFQPMIVDTKVVQPANSADPKGGAAE